MAIRLSLRPIVCPDDLNFLFQVYASTRLEELAPLNWTREQLSAFLSMQFNAQHTFYLQTYNKATYDIILADDQPAGRLYVDRAPDQFLIIDIALLPAFRNKGIGTHYLTELIAEAEQKGLPVSIHVERNNPALRLYTRLGFEMSEDQGVYFFMTRQPEGVKDAR